MSRATSHEAKGGPSQQWLSWLCIYTLAPPESFFLKGETIPEKRKKEEKFPGSNGGPRDSFDLGILFGSPPGIELGTFGGLAPGRPERKKMQIGALSGDRTGDVGG